MKRLAIGLLYGLTGVSLNWTDNRPFDLSVVSLIAYVLLGFVLLMSALIDGESC